MKTDKIGQTIWQERPIRNSELILRYKPEGRERPWEKQNIWGWNSWLLTALVIKRFRHDPESWITACVQQPQQIRSISWFKFTSRPWVWEYLTYTMKWKRRKITRRIITGRRRRRKIFHIRSLGIPDLYHEVKTKKKKKKENNKKKDNNKKKKEEKKKNFSYQKFGNTWPIPWSEEEEEGK